MKQSAGYPKGSSVRGSQGNRLSGRKTVNKIFRMKISLDFFYLFYQEKRLKLISK